MVNFGEVLVRLSQWLTILYTIMIFYTLERLPPPRMFRTNQHYDGYRVNQIFKAWAGVCRDRGSVLRRLIRCWESWKSYSSKRRRTKALRKKTVRSAHQQTSLSFIGLIYLVMWSRRDSIYTAVNKSEKKGQTGRNGVTIFSINKP